MTVNERLPLNIYGTSMCKIVMAFLFATLCISPGWAAVDDSKITDNKTRLEYARVLSYQKKYDESLAEYQKVLKEDPSLIEAKIEMAKVYYYQKEYDKAITTLNDLPKKDLTPELHIILGDTYVAQKDYDKAEKAYEVALEANPKNDLIRMKIADLLSWQKKYDGALDIYQKLVQEHPEDIQLRRKYAMILIWAGKDAEAAQELKQTLK